MLIEYVWLDVNGSPRSKSRVSYQKRPEKLEDVTIPFWNYDGSSTGQAEGRHSEIILKPQSVFPDPFRGGDSLMVLCDTYNPDMTPHGTNTRHVAQEKFSLWPNAEPMFGIEQEFFIMKGTDILAKSVVDEIAPQGQYYCGSGSNCAIGREIVESAFKRCIIAGIRLTGLNAEVAPSQWELQVCTEGIEAADQLVMMRYILNRTAEMFGTWINYEPKPLKGDWNGSGCHVNFSTKSMREEGGYEHIVNAIKKLEDTHEKHIAVYGKNNELRLTGEHETSSMTTFTSGVADRGASVRIPHDTVKNGKGYFEDRRPASNMDPYVVTSLLLETSLSN
jgi:glutamine synthetase